MKRLFISSEIPKTTRSKLEDFGFVLYLLPPCKTLPEPISTHADILLFFDGELFVSEDYYRQNESLFSEFSPTITEDVLGEKYPDDIAFNCFVLGDTLFGKTDYISKAVTGRYQNSVKLKQGYAKCSCILLGSSVITADENIYRAVTDNGYEALIITAGNILLPGYDCGFIGGASVVFDNTVFFFGDITQHPDYERIADFCSLKNYKIAYDENYPLTDYGGGVIS